MCFYF